MAARDLLVEIGKEGGNLGSTPTVDGDRVYAVGQDGDLVCVDARKEGVVWKRNFKSLVPMNSTP